MKKFLLLGLLLALIAGAFAYYQYQRPLQRTENLRADFALAAQELFDAFEGDEQAANDKYLGKVIEVSGAIAEIAADDEGELSLTLAAGSELFGVVCQFDPRSPHRPEDFQPGQEVRLKGVCTGMLMDVVLVRCIAL